jgi:hypothetical protein
MRAPLLLSLPLLAALGCTTDHPTPGAAALGLADVSVLFPLPTSLTDPALLRLDSPGNGGPLLTQARFDALPVFHVNAPGGTSYADWRIVAARLDPCFPSLALLTTNPAACRRQVRLIAQPMGPAADGSGGPIAAQDAAIHLLYDLSEAEFATLAARWIAVRTPRSSDPARALGVHVEIAAEGNAGPIATELRATILAHAGTATLSQLTFMEGRGVAWAFGGLRIINGQATPIAIHGTGATDQTTTSDNIGIFNFQPASPEGTAMLSIAGEFVPDPNGNIGGGTVKLTAPPAALQAALTQSLAFDDPTQLDADTADCAGCHAATRARARAATLGASADALPRFALAPYNLGIDAQAPFVTSMLQQRAFGYNGTFAIWNQRVVNESAAVAAELTTELLP